MNAPLPTLERLGKLIPRLASDQAGEVVATVAAIGRTLAGAGLDWHDLAKRIAEPSLPSLDDLMAEVFRQKPPQPRPPDPEPTWESPPPLKKRYEPPPWPTWGMLSHFGRLEAFDRIAKSTFSLPPDKAEAFAVFHQSYYRHGCGGTRKNTNTFNRACKELWQAGWRPEVGR